MNFYVYEDDETKRVRVHTGRCGHCKEGQGRKSGRRPNNRWHGPYTTLSAAQTFAKTLKKKDTRTCGTCLEGSKV